MFIVMTATIFMLSFSIANCDGIGENIKYKILWFKYKYIITTVLNSQMAGIFVFFWFFFLLSSSILCKSGSPMEGLKLNNRIIIIMKRFCCFFFSLNCMKWFAKATVGCQTNVCTYCTTCNLTYCLLRE